MWLYIYNEASHKLHIHLKGLHVQIGLLSGMKQLVMSITKLNGALIYNVEGLVCSQNLNSSLHN